MAAADAVGDIGVAYGIGKKALKEGPGGGGNRATEGGGGGVATASQKTTKLDWNAVVPKKGKYKGQARTDHVRLHNVDNPNKSAHGVFFDDAVDVTNEAWARAQSLGLSPTNFTLTVPMVRQVGVAGGIEGSAAYIPLHSVTIHFVPGTNKIITPYPSL